MTCNSEIRCTYPNIGRVLTQADVGKHVARVVPRNDRDWSHCFFKGENLTYCGGELKALSPLPAGKVTFKYVIYDTMVTEITEDNGPYWATREEIEKYLRTNPVGVDVTFLRFDIGQRNLREK